MPKLTFILGGARGGKSTYAEQLAKQHPGKVLYIATAQALDSEMENRIEKHKRQRPDTWQSLEIPLDVGRQVTAHLPEEGLVLLDCLTMLTANVVLESCGDIDNPEEKPASEAVMKEIDQLLITVKNSACDWIIVSNEVGMGVVPPYPTGRLYRDLLGWANRKVATVADEVFLLVAGMVLPIHELGSPFQPD